MTQVVFWSALFLSVVSIGVAVALSEPYRWIGLSVLLVSIVFNLWSVRRSDNEGFVRSREHRRAYEPARRFNMLQVFVLFGAAMLQCGIGAHALIA